MHAKDLIINKPATGETIADLVWFIAKLKRQSCSLGLIWLAESTVGWFFGREKHC
jgi:hypothetical protein